MEGCQDRRAMHTFSAVIERCPETGLLVDYIRGCPGANSEGETLDELQTNLQEVISMLQQISVPA